MARIEVLGSAAAEGIPAIFCGCRVCRAAWENGGKDIRMRTAYRLNDRVRIDFGPDSLAQEYRYGLHSERLRHLFITHSHEDHFVADLLDYRMKGFSVVEEDNILNVYGNAGVIRALNLHFWRAPYFCGDYRRFRLNPVMIEPFRSVPLPEEDMEFFPILADHMIGSATELPCNYVVRCGGSWALIANDTGYYREETWQYLEDRRFRLDLVISDCTGGLLDQERGHMSGKHVLQAKRRLERIGSVTDRTQYYINHFSHNGRATHAELEEFYNPHGIQVAYDGLAIQF